MLKKFLKIAPLFLLAAVAAAQTIPAGTSLTVRVNSAISSGTAKVGDRFDATLTKALVVGGKTLAPSGATARGKVTFVKNSGRLHEPGQLTLRLTSVQVNGKAVPLASSAYHVEGKSHTKSNATKIGGGAAAGAVIGALAGGGKGAAIGGLVGAGAGTGVAAATGKQEVEIQSESAITFKTTAAAKVK